MSKSRKKRKSPKRILALPDLEQSKSAVLNTLTSKSGQRTYDHAIDEFVQWYCSEPRLAFNRTVVLRHRIHLEQKQCAPATINLRLAAARRVAYEAADSGLLSPELAAGIRRVRGVRRLGVRVGNWLTAQQGKRLLQSSARDNLRGKRNYATEVCTLVKGREIRGGSPNLGYSYGSGSKLRMTSLDRSSVIPVTTMGTGWDMAVSNAGLLVITSYGEMYSDFSPPLSLARILHRILSPSETGYSSVTAQNIQPVMVSPGGMLEWMRWSRVGIFKSPAFVIFPYIQYSRPPSAGICLNESHRFPCSCTSISSRSMYAGEIRGFFTVMYKAADTGERVSPYPDGYRNQNTPLVGFLEPSKFLNKRENTNSGSLDSLEYRITAKARIQSAAVPIKPKVIAAALICVLVAIATTNQISVPKNAMVEFCTQPLENA